MKQTVNFNDFTDAFKGHGRENQFTYDGLRALFDYLEGLEESGCDEIELNVIALCCEYTEYENLAEFQNDYNITDYETIEDVENETTVIRVDDERFIIQSF